jgi:hypothetical protein
MHIQQLQQTQWWWSKQWPWCPKTTNHEFSVIRAAANSRPFVRPLPTSFGRIGTTVTPTAVMLMTLTPVQVWQTRTYAQS